MTNDHPITVEYNDIDFDTANFIWKYVVKHDNKKNDRLMVARISQKVRKLNNKLNNSLFYFYFYFYT